MKVYSITLTITMLFLAGCATMFGNEYGAHPGRNCEKNNVFLYRGTVMDLAFISFYSMWADKRVEAESFYLWPVAVIDLPFSFVLDTWQLPQKLSDKKEHKVLCEKKALSQKLKEQGAESGTL